MQDGVHDFGWTADPRFVEVNDTFSATRDVTADEYRHAALVLGRSADSLRLSDVSIRLLMQPGRTPQIARYLAAAKLAIKCFGLWYGAYPYRTLTIVDPPSDAPGAEGMEYPTFITAGTTSASSTGGRFSHVREPEEVVVHEYAHQYWYGLVASNEFEEAWLDEGFTSYSTGQAMELGFGTAQHARRSVPSSRSPSATCCAWPTHRNTGSIACGSRHGPTVPARIPSTPTRSPSSCSVRSST